MMTKINYLNANNDGFIDSVNVKLTCDYCKKSGTQSSFLGRFCSKICIGKFAQIKSVLSRKQKKFFNSSTNILSNANSVHGSFNGRKIFKNLLTRKSNTTAPNKNTNKGFYEFGDKNSCPYTFHVTDSENSQTIKETINRAKAKLNKKFISNSNLHTPKIIKTCPVPSNNLVKLKRGRPPSKKPTDLQANMFESTLKAEAKIKLSKRKLKILENEIKESVYISKTSDTSDVFKTLSYKYDSQLVADIACKEDNEVNSWNIQAVSNFIKSIPGCSSFASLFELEEIDGQAMLLLQQSDLIRIMKIKLGPALKIFNHILKLKHSLN